MGIAYLVVIVTSSLESLLVSPALCALLLPSVKITRREPRFARMCKIIYGRCLKFSFRHPLLIIATALALTRRFHPYYSFLWTGIFTRISGTNNGEYLEFISW